MGHVLIDGLGKYRGIQAVVRTQREECMQSSGKMRPFSMVVCFPPHRLYCIHAEAQGQWIVGSNQPQVRDESLDEPVLTNECYDAKQDKVFARERLQKSG